VPLKNRDATKDCVIHKLNWLKSDIKQGDTIVFFFTGHGASFPELDSNGQSDEIDGYDEGLNLYGGVLVDDELNHIFSNISQKVNVTVICDSCFSGGIMDHNKYLPQPVNNIVRSSPDAKIRRFGDRFASTILLLAACEEGQQASQGTDETNFQSVFTYFSNEVILCEGSDIKAEKFIIKVKEKIEQADLSGVSQIPQIKGRKELFDKPLFGSLLSD
jgi:hypothetical protein